MRVHLISPRPPFVGATKRDKAIQFSRLSLVTVAALFPEDAEVQIINDSIDTIDFDQKVDLVGITSMTSTAPRAYEIADRFREKGVPVILGGFHVTALPQEASLHADAVIMGEAEGVMHDVINDLQIGKLKKFYQATEMPSLVGLPLPRWDLLNGSKYYSEVNMVQTTRGCPFNCAFCSVSDFYGRTYRTRPIPDVIREIKELSNRTVIFFVDDNIAGRPSYAKKLFKALIPLNIKWFGQGSVMIARDRELLELAARSGCLGLFMGFESLSNSNLRQVGKATNNVRNYSTVIKKIHGSGIGIVGAFIFGLDSDDDGVFEETVRFIENNQLELASFAILTPLPGTRLLKSMKEQGRIIELDWAKYTLGEVVFRPKLLTVDQLKDGYNWTRKHMSSYSSIFRRTLHFRKTALLSLPLNLLMRKSSRKFLKNARASRRA
ncbi:B12-binding domain-containing radical SAM protein [candidate division TA06 bacterium]|uniref:B12-binding domain-containing radical SAM protein n=1 Tax=candidate division TA06 bacterium TaxID=2250710 RepID=A0A523UVD0_UNCT6|nr:MAG: B12-binding domain-containing radical SAM protein [candidate division TA06 bacterium]